MGCFYRGLVVLFAGAARPYGTLTQQNPTVGAGHTRDAILQLK